MTAPENLRRLRHLLEREGIPLTGWQETEHRGFSGARIYRMPRGDSHGHVLKVTSFSTDWIMRATSDRQCREAVLANTDCLRVQGVSSPTIGSAQDGAVFSTLMHDISPHLLSAGKLTLEQLDTLCRGMSRLHAEPPPDPADIPWCAVAARLTLFAPDSQKLTGFRIAEDILRGWELFFDRAPRDVARLVRSLFDDVTPLVSALDRMPNSLLHGDLKLDNIAIHPDNTLSLIDWAMALVAPAAVELGWFLAVNSRALPVSLDDALAAYTSHSSLERPLQQHHEALTVLCGLLLRGWRKALDAELADPSELHWWCGRASQAAQLL